jgi:hypothetical protein
MSNPQFYYSRKSPNQFPFSFLHFPYCICFLFVIGKVVEKNLYSHHPFDPNNLLFRCHFASLHSKNLIFFTFISLSISFSSLLNIPTSLLHTHTHTHTHPSIFILFPYPFVPYCFYPKELLFLSIS